MTNLLKDRIVAHRSAPDVYDPPTFEQMADHIEELEAKLAKAMKTLSCYAGHWVDDKTFIRTDDGGELAGETIAELTGDKDE